MVCLSSARVPQSRSFPPWLYAGADPRTSAMPRRRWTMVHRYYVQPMPDSPLSLSCQLQVLRRKTLQLTFLPPMLTRTGRTRPGCVLLGGYAACSLYLLAPSKFLFPFSHFPRLFHLKLVRIYNLPLLVLQRGTNICTPRRIPLQSNLAAR